MPAQKGDTVQVHYTGTLVEDGTQFDSSLEREPLEFTLGEGMVIAGFEKAVLGMNVGDTKTVDIPADEGYGQYNPDFAFQVDKKQLPENIDPEPGMMLEVRTDQGLSHVIIRDVGEEEITLDGNHPLAGKDLRFELTLVKTA